MNKQLLETLDFDKIIEYFKKYFKYNVTKELYTLFIFESGNELKENIKVTEEFFKYPINEDKFNFLKKVDIRTHLKYIEKNLLINPEDFLEIASMSDDFRKFSKYVESLKDGEFSILKKKIDLFSREIPESDKEVYKIIDKNGIVKSTASMKLLDIRKRIKSHELHIRNTLKDYLSRRDLNKYLQEDFYTIRKERFVLPLKSSFKGTIKGIVHDRSNTGETVFIEPTEVLESNNKLILEKKKEEEEIKRILKELILVLKPYMQSLLDLIEVYVQIDLFFSRFKFSQALDAHPVTISPSFNIDLRNVYNPLMKLENPNKTKAINIKMDNNTHTMIISGPNAGGKTVALKTIGMVYLLVKSAIFPPLEEDSTFFISNNLFAIIGDNQSIEKNQSSFTSHLKELDYAYKKSNKDDLILIDEILQNTAPETGAALSKGYLDSVSNKRVRTIVTTHYNELKYYALEQDKFLNASVQLDENMEPTYKLYYNQISDSLPLEIAKNLKISPEIIENSKKHLAIKENSVTKLIDKLNKKINFYEEKSQKLKENEKKFKKFQEEERKFKLEKSKFMLKKEKMIKEELDNTRLQMKTYLKDINKKSKKEQEDMLKKLDNKRFKKDNQIKELNKKVSLDDDDILNLNEISVAQKVFVKSLSTHGTIINISKKRITVQTDNMKITTKINDLAPAKSKNDLMIDKIKKKIKVESKENDKTITDETMIRTKKNTLDIIGKDRYDSEPLIDHFLDKLYYQNKQYGYIIHGHGTGILKKHVRGFLKKHPLVRSYMKAPNDDGGDAVTIAMLDI